MAKAKQNKTIAFNSILGWVLIISLVIAMLDLIFAAWEIRNATTQVTNHASLLGLNLFELTKKPIGNDSYEASITVLRGLGYYFATIFVITVGYGVYKIRKSS